MAPLTSHRAATPEFAENTSLHGVSRVADKENHPLRRVTWLIMVLSATGIALHQAYMLIAKYYRFEVSGL